jgi:transcription termination/antitermination protein NusG
MLSPIIASCRSSSITAVDVDGPRLWFAVKTRARHEKKVRDRLLNRGLELLLPLVLRRQRWSDRIKHVELPLFSCYCFVRLSEDTRRVVLEAPGVVSIVGYGERPEPIPEPEIEALKRLCLSKLPCDVYPHLAEGAMVEIVRGPLAGVRGRLLKQDGSVRLALTVNLLQQSAVVKIDASDVQPVTC